MLDPEGYDAIDTYDSYRKDYPEDAPEGIPILWVKGYLPELGELTFTADNGCTVEFMESDREGYAGKAICTNSYGIDKTYYITYVRSDRFYFSGVKAFFTDENGKTKNAVSSYAGNPKYDENNKLLYRYFDIYLWTDHEYDEMLFDVTKLKSVKSEETESDLEGYDKLVVVSNGDETNEYYISYSQMEEKCTYFGDSIFYLDDIKEVTTDHEYEVGTIYSGKNVRRIFAFTPTEDGTYEFKAKDNDNYQTYASLYNADRKEIAYHDAKSEFIIKEDLKAGETYYLACSCNYYTESFPSYHIAVTQVED